MGKNSRYSHVVVLGCGRSGTSIFGELFEDIPGYSYYSEPSFDEFLQLDFSNPVAAKVPKESDKHVSSPGLSFPLEKLLTVVPKPMKVYWQVRHPLDTVASLTVGISKNWGHHPKPPDWQDWLNRPLIERCAHHWDYINRVGYQQVKDIAEVCYFEDMVGDPKAFAQRIYLDIGGSANNTNILQNWASRVQDRNNDKFIEARTSREYSRPDHIKKVGRWRENLNKEQVAMAIPIVEETAKLFGYDLSEI